MMHCEICSQKCEPGDVDGENSVKFGAIHLAFLSSFRTFEFFFVTFASQLFALVTAAAKFVSKSVWQSVSGHTSPVAVSG
jgi:hypothetical protein